VAERRASADQQTGAGISQLPPGSLRLNDLGFFNLETFRQDRACGVDFFSRYKVGTTLFLPSGERLDLVKYLRQQHRRPVDIAVLVGEQRLAVRLLALPLPPDLVRQRRRKLRQKASRKQQPVSERSLALAAWTIYLTSLPPERLRLEEAPILGTTRWQIECLFNLWKTSGRLDETRSQDPWRVWCEFYAKLLALLLQHWLTLVGCWQRLDRSLHRAAQLIRKSAFHLAFHLSDLLALTDALAHTCGMSKRLAHPLTFQYWLEVVDG
jgi:DDE family transposase